MRDEIRDEEAEIATVSGHLTHNDQAEDAITQPVARHDHRFGILADDLSRARLVRIHGLLRDTGDDARIGAASMA